MPEALVVDQEKVALEAEAAAEAEFEAGYSDTPTETPPADEGTDEPVVKTEALAAEVSPLIEPPKFHQVTEAEWLELNAKAAEVDEVRRAHRGELDKAFGKVGGLERTLKEIQSATPSGFAVDVTDDVVADLKAEFPELGDLTLKAFKKFASGLKGTAAPAAAVDPQQVEKAVSARLQALQTEALEDEHADWREIVGAQDSDTAYRKWLATQDAAYQQKLNATNSAAIISRSIAKFKTGVEAATIVAQEAAVVKTKKDAADKAAKEAVNTRQRRLASAATERGTGGHAPGASSDDDDFNEGFTS